jgi:hypothetical protein
MKESYSRLMGLAAVSENLVRHGVTMSRDEPRKLALSVTIAATLLAIVLSPTLFAQTNVGPSTERSVNRYLFIVETSRAMQPRARGVFDAIKHALDSSLNGQIHQGDLVGIWTFNEVVYQELFPTQVWSQPTQLAFAVRLPTFADPELYQRRARLDKVVPEMLKVIAGSDNVTTILISTGDGVMQGTPFDTQINSAWKEWYDELEGIHMPLQTVIRASAGQPIDWFTTPAPRPIDLTRLATAPRSGDQNGKNPAGVILESGLVTNQPSSLGTEQQVAFSVWALGKTGLMASATSPQKISTPHPKTNDSAPPAADSATNMPNVQPSGSFAAQSEPSKTGVVPKEEAKKSAITVPASTREQDGRTPGDSQSVTPGSNAPPSDNGKPVELVFVTNAPAQPTPVAETTVKESAPTPSPTSAPPAPAASSLPDVPNNHQQILAHARAADPSREEKPGVDVALATPPRGFLRDNMKPLALMILAGLGAVYCFRMWHRTNARSKGNAFSLTQPEPDESVGQEP